MKKAVYLSILPVVFSIITLNVFCQRTTTTLYDCRWQVCDASLARFFSVLEKTDSGWFRNNYFVSTKKIQMSALYKDQYCNVKNGYISYFYPNGNLEARGRMIDNKREGNYMSWHFNGMIEDSAFYHNDRFIGYKLSWHSNGMIADSSFRRNDSTTVYVSWFDNGSPSAYGVFLNGKKQGQWNYFHKSGNKAAIEINERGKVSMVDYFNEDGTTLQDNSYANRDAVFKEGLNDWNEYLIDHVFLPGTYKFTNTNQVTIEVSFTINEDGDTEDAIVLTPFQYRVDQEVLDAIKASPKWHPAIEHNRKVKMKIKQPHTFVR